MNKKQKIIFTGRIIVVFITLLYDAISIIQVFTGAPLGKIFSDARLSSIVYIFTLIIMAWWIGEKEYQDYKWREAKPALKIKNCDIEDKGFVMDIVRKAAFIEVYNAPGIKLPTENSIARRVSATVKWEDINGKLINENHGRWWIPNPENEDKKLNLQTVDIYPNGQEVKLHFAQKSTGDKYFYAWGRTQDGNDDLFELREAVYIVKIQLLGINVREEFEFTFDQLHRSIKIRN
jgi:hypothetical protein